MSSSNSRSTRNGGQSSINYRSLHAVGTSTGSLASSGRGQLMSAALGAVQSLADSNRNRMVPQLSSSVASSSTIPPSDSGIPASQLSLFSGSDAPQPPSTVAPAPSSSTPTPAQRSRSRWDQMSPRSASSLLLQSNSSSSATPPSSAPVVLDPPSAGSTSSFVSGSSSQSSVASSTMNPFDTPLVANRVSTSPQCPRWFCSRWSV